MDELAGALGAASLEGPDLPLFRMLEGAWHYRIPPSTVYAPVPVGANFYHDIWNPKESPYWKEMEAVADVQFLRGGFDTRSYLTKPAAVGDMGCVKWSSRFASHAHGLVGAFIVVAIGLDQPEHNKYYNTPVVVQDHPSTAHPHYTKIVMEPFPAAIQAAKIPKSNILGFNQEHESEFYKLGPQFWKEISRELFLKELDYGLA